MTLTSTADSGVTEMRPTSSLGMFACRSCGSIDVPVFLSLGSSPLANGLLRPGDDTSEKAYPLDVAFCRNCSLVQLTYTPSPDDLFRDYPYFSSFSDTMVDHARKLVAGLIAERCLTRESLAVELASNDGYLLQFYKDAGVRVLGIEPALNIANVARERGIETVSEFFDVDLATSLAADGVEADVIHAHNVLAHVPDVNSFVAGIGVLLKPDGVAMVEAPYLGDLIEKVEFDTIYHEHHSYFSLTALDALFSRHGLTIFDVERIPIHGGTLRIQAGHTQPKQPSQRTLDMLQDERVIGMDGEGFYRDFGHRVEQLKRDLLACLDDIKGRNERIAAYGASAKGTTLLTHCGIGANYLDFVVDRSTVKQGHLTPGSHLPIYAPSHLLEAMPDYTLLLVWNFADEIMSQQSEYRGRGGRFIIPVPVPRIV